MSSKKCSESLLYIVLRPIITVLFKFLFTPKIVGKENIPKNGRIIIAGNHTNNLDCALLISSIKRPIHFLAKVELFKGFKKIIFSNMGLIPVDRSKKNPDALKKAKDYLMCDKVIGIFPEGTIPKKANSLPYKMGAVKMAKDTQTRIVPFAITGNYKLFSRTLKIEFGEAITIENSDLNIENEKLKNKVIELVGDKNVHI